jgi:hypothetical protein
VFDVVLGFFLLGALLFMAGGLLSLLWRLALQDEGIPLQAAFYSWPSPQFVAELRLLARLFKGSGAGAGERHRRAARACFLLAGLSLAAFFVSAIFDSV